MKFYNSIAIAIFLIVSYFYLVIIMINCAALPKNIYHTFFSPKPCSPTIKAIMLLDVEHAELYYMIFHTDSYSYFRMQSQIEEPRRSASSSDC